jgi:hypothetical protein
MLNTKLLINLLEKKSKPNIDSVYYYLNCCMEARFAKIMTSGGRGGKVGCRFH